MLYDNRARYRAKVKDDKEAQLRRWGWYVFEWLRPDESPCSTEKHIGHKYASPFCFVCFFLAKLPRYKRATSLLPSH